MTPAKVPAHRPRLRSLLYVPANRPQWFGKALASGADAVILDLEDAVPEGDRAAARACVAELLAAAPGVPVFVRISPAFTQAARDDLSAIASPALAGVVLAKCGTEADIHWLDAQLDHLESRLGLAHGAVAITPLLETAAAMRSAFEICSASARIAYAGGLTARGGDIQRALGFRWSPEGQETLYVRSKILLDARAAAVAHPVSGVWTAIEDVQGLRAFAEHSRDLGYEGLAVVHPSHVAIVHEAFGARPGDLDHAEEVLRVMMRALDNDEATGRANGEMVDLAMATTAAQELTRARRATPLVRDYQKLRGTHAV